MKIQKIIEIKEALDFMAKTGDVSKIAQDNLTTGLEELDEQFSLYGVVSSLFALIDEDNDIVMPLFLDKQKAIETRAKYLKDGLRKAITVNRLEVI